MVDLRQLAVTRGLCGRNGGVRVTVDSEFENGAIIGLGAAERSNDNTGIGWFGEGEELDWQLLLGLDRCGVSLWFDSRAQFSSRIPVRLWTFHFP